MDPTFRTTNFNNLRRTYYWLIKSLASRLPHWQGVKSQVIAESLWVLFSSLVPILMWSIYEIIHIWTAVTDENSYPIQEINRHFFQIFAKMMNMLFFTQSLLIPKKLFEGLHYWEINSKTWFQSKQWKFWKITPQLRMLLLHDWWDLVWWSAAELTK